MAQLDATMICKVVAQILEEAAFCFVEESEQSALSGAEQFSFLTHFHGDAVGRILLVADGEFGEELAANLLGLDSGEADLESTKAALSEILNMVAGPLITAWFGDDARCEISPPEPVALEDVASLKQKYPLAAHLVSEEESGIDLYVSDQAD